MRAWRIVRRSPGLIALQSDDASLILEAARPAGGDPELREAAVRLAPQLTFGAVQIRDSFIERVATSGDERVVIGRYSRGARSIAYLVASRDPIAIDDVVVAQLGDVASPFEYLAD